MRPAGVNLCLHLPIYQALPPAERHTDHAARRPTIHRPLPRATQPSPDSVDPVNHGRNPDGLTAPPVCTISTLLLVGIHLSLAVYRAYGGQEAVRGDVSETITRVVSFGVHTLIRGSDQTSRGQLCRVHRCTFGASAWGEDTGLLDSPTRGSAYGQIEHGRHDQAENLGAAAGH